MPDTDQLATIGLKLTMALTSAYGSTDPNAALVFLPGGINVPGDIVQNGVVNFTQIETFLEASFDTPFVMSPSESAVHGSDLSYGRSSEIYMIAATAAQPVGSPTDDTWKRVAAEIAGAQRNLPGAGAQSGLVCEPDDWFQPSNTDYWTSFDSTQTETTPPPNVTGSAPHTFVPNTRLWVMRTPAMMPLHLSPAVATASVMHAAPQPAAAPAPSAPAPRAAMAPLQARSTVGWRLGGIEPPPSRPPVDPPPPPPPPPSESVSVRLQHQCVTLGYLSGGAPWWSAVFLNDLNWYIPGMTRGGLLPVPQPTADHPDLVYGRPIAMIIVKNLEISGNWTNEGASSVGSIGPFSLAGVTPTSGTNGVMTFARHGMQVIALLCSKLPVLPPVDAPAAAKPSDPAPTTNSSTPAASGGSAGTTTPPATTPSGGTSDSSAAQPSSGTSTTPSTSSQAASSTTTDTGKPAASG